jgi:hypothetical protein
VLWEDSYSQYELYVGCCKLFNHALASHDTEWWNDGKDAVVAHFAHCPRNSPVGTEKPAEDIRIVVSRLRWEPDASWIQINTYKCRPTSSEVSVKVKRENAGSFSYRCRKTLRRAHGNSWIASWMYAEPHRRGLYPTNAQAVGGYRPVLWYLGHISFYF